MKTPLITALVLCSSLAFAAGDATTGTTRAPNDSYGNPGHRDIRGIPSSSDSMYRDRANDVDPDMTRNLRSEAPRTTQDSGTRDTSPTGDPTVQKE